MSQAAKLGDETVKDALTKAASYIGIGVANVVSILHPELIILSGGVSQIGDILFDTVRDTVRKRVGMFPPDNVQIQPSLLGADAGTLGGIALAMKGNHL
jgi:glucokinase